VIGAWCGVFRAAVFIGTLLTVGCATQADETTRAAVTVTNVVQSGDRAVAVVSDVSHTAAESDETAAVIRLLNCEFAERESATKDVAAYGRGAVRTILGHWRTSDTERNSLLLRAIQQIEFGDVAGQKTGDNFKWDESAVVKCLADDDPSIRGAALVVLRDLYGQLPNQIGLIGTLRQSRRDTRYWDVICGIASLLESFAECELIMTMIAAGDEAKRTALDSGLKRLMAIGDPARLGMMQTIRNLDPTLDTSLAEADIRSRKRWLWDRVNRRMADNRLFVPPSDLFEKFDQELEAVRSKASKQTSLMDELSSCLKMLWIRRNQELLAEAKLFLPDPRKVTDEYVSSDSAVADILMTAAEALAPAADKYPIAARLLCDSLMISRQAEPPRSNVRLNRTWSDLACVLEKLSPDKAPDIHRYAIEQIESSITDAGKDETRPLKELLGAAVSRAADCAWNRSDLANALTLQSRYVQLAADFSGSESLAVAVARNRLAAIQAESSDVESAISSVKQALAILSKLRPQSDVQFVDSISQLSGYLVKSGKSDDADTLVRNALGEMRQTRGEKDVQTARLLSLRGRCLVGMGELDEAEQYVSQALATMAALGKGEIAPTATAHEILGEVHRAKHRDERARRDFQECLRIRVKLYGDEHPYTRRAGMAVSEMDDLISRNSPRSKP
jgi:tetratricopeptide (TPR) repeat protein